MRTILLFVTALLLSSSLFAAESYEQKPIGSIEVTLSKGTQTQADAVKQRLKVREGALFSQTEFDEDLKMLSQEYERVDPKVSVQDGKLQLTLSLVPKPVIREIHWNGNKSLKSHRLQKELDIAPGSTFDRETFLKAFHKVKEYVIKKGYFEAELDFTTKLDPESGTIDIDIEVNEGRSGHIDSFVFHGFTKSEESELRELILTKEYSWLTSWATGEGSLRTELWQHDEMTITNFLRNQGFADATVVTKIEETKDKSYIVINITAKKGEPYHVGDVSIKGETIFTNEELMKLAAIKKGDLYSPDKVTEAMRAIAEHYGKKGYADLQVTPELDLVDGKVYNIRFDIIEGKPFRVGLVKVFGNTRTKASVILHESLLVPGELFNSSLISKTEERLKNTNYFTHVNVYAVKSKQAIQTDAPFRDVHIEVEENPTTANFRTSLAFATGEGLLFSLGLNENNFNAAGIPEIFTKGLKSIRGGGEFIGAEASFGTRQTNYTLSWTKPYFRDTKWTVGFDVSKRKSSYTVDRYITRSNTLRLFGHYQFNAFLGIEPYYRLNHSFISLKYKKADRHARELRRESQNDGLISAAGLSLVYDSRNHPMVPTKGLRSSVGAELAGLGGDHNFAKFHYLNSYFYSPYKGGVFLLKGNLQFIQTYGGTHPRDIPLAERLYSGGESSIRGFVFNSVGPTFHDKFRTPRGGMSEALLSAEFSQYLHKRVDGFVFFDAGNVYFREFYLGKLRASYGYGVKLRILPGSPPIILGLGYPINPAHKRDEKRFFLTFSTSL